MSVESLCTPTELNIDYQEYHILISGLVWILKKIGVQANNVEKSAYKVTANKYISNSFKIPALYFKITHSKFQDHKSRPMALKMRNMVLIFGSPQIVFKATLKATGTGGKA